MSSARANEPCRGEVWLAGLDPTIGDEMRKTRPAVVINSDSLGRLHLKLIVPLTEWKDGFAGNVWHVRLDPEPRNGVSKPSAADVMQIRGVDVRRLIRRLGVLSPGELAKVLSAVGVVIELASLRDQP